MTVIEFKKREFTNRILRTIVVISVCVAFFGGIFLYNTVAALRQDIAHNSELLERAQVQKRGA
jgi:hypothetical protein